MTTTPRKGQEAPSVIRMLQVSTCDSKAEGIVTELLEAAEAMVAKHESLPDDAYNAEAFMIFKDIALQMKAAIRRAREGA